MDQKCKFSPWKCTLTLKNVMYMKNTAPINNSQIESLCRVIEPNLLALRETRIGPASPLSLDLEPTLTITSPLWCILAILPYKDSISQCTFILTTNHLISAYMNPSVGKNKKPRNTHSSNLSFMQTFLAQWNYHLHKYQQWSLPRNNIGDNNQ